jgi:hypothetical protein
MARNENHFAPVVTQRLRIWFEHAAPTVTAISEIELQ